MGKSLTIGPFVSLALLLGACGGPDSVPLDDLGDTIIDAYCDRAVRCGAFASEDACRSYLGGLLEADDLIRSVEAGRTNYDGEAAGECIDQLRGASCDVTTEDSRVEPPACDDAFDGTVADGGTCFDDEECVNDNCDVPACDMACCMGTCVAGVPVPAIGQPCPDFECQDGAFCNAAGNCAALLATGSPCTDSDECAYGLYCPEGAATCTDAPNRGDACPAGECADLGDRCDQTSTTCVALSRAGEPCSAGFAGFFDCQQPLVCNQTSLVCENPPGVGQPCNFFCASGAFCNDVNTCEATRANGSACQSDSECSSTYCDDFAAAPVCADDPVCG